VQARSAAALALLSGDADVTFHTIQRISESCVSIEPGEILSGIHRAPLHFCGTDNCQYLIDSWQE
jgi:hypothetical protein